MQKPQALPAATFWTSGWHWSPLTSPYGKLLPVVTSSHSDPSEGMLAASLAPVLAPLLLLCQPARSAPHLGVFWPLAPALFSPFCTVLHG